MTYEDGSKYAGEWKSNWREGSGSLFYTDGSEFRGTFRGDQCLHGGWVLRLSDGIVQRENDDVQ